MKVVAYTQADGSLAVIIPANKFVEEMRAAAEKLGVPMTDAQLAAAAAGKALEHAKGADPVLCEDADLPQDRTFRNAWARSKDKPVVVDMTKALEIAKDMIRAERKPLLAAQDVEFTRAQGQKDDEAAATVEAKRQALRDATADARLAGAKDASALKTAMEAVIAEMKQR